MCLVVILPRKNTFEKNTIKQNSKSNTVHMCQSLHCQWATRTTRTLRSCLLSLIVLHSFQKKKLVLQNKTIDLHTSLYSVHMHGRAGNRDMFKSWETSGSGPPSYFPSIPIGKNACANVLYVIQTHNSNESDFIDNSIELNKLNAKSAKINRIVRWSTIVLLNIYEYM